MARLRGAVSLRVEVRHLTRRGILCSLAVGRVKFVRRPAAVGLGAAPSEESPVAPVPSIDRDREDPQPSLDPLFRLLQADLDRVNAVIVERMDSPVALIPQLAGHIVSAGGKRLRPMLTLGCARLCGYRGDRHIALAAAVEFIHTATLLHDDVVDDSGLRRGRDTANAVWGNKPAVLVGDFLFARSFQLMVEDGSLRVLDILSRTSAIIAEGEVHQLITANDTASTEAAYLEVIEAKTAALFAAASRIGAVLADRPSEEEEAMARFGRNLGIAYQLIDDMLDFSAHQSEFGKSVGDDFRDGKITLPILIAFARGDGEERAFWRRTLEQGEQGPDDLDRAMRLVERRGALMETLARARAYAAAAVDSLSSFPAGPLRRALAEAATFATERGF
jgi:octaprenyl-diphosphate synthase